MEEGKNYVEGIKNLKALVKTDLYHKRKQFGDNMELKDT